MNWALFDRKVVDNIAEIFSKALRADWQYHVLFEIPLFYEHYSIHQGIEGAIEDRKHVNRMNKFKELIEQLQGRVKNRVSHRHVRE